jgi:hypothetical protein
MTRAQQVIAFIDHAELYTYPSAHVCRFCGTRQLIAMVQVDDNGKSHGPWCMGFYWHGGGCERRAAVQRIWGVPREFSAIMRPGVNGNPPAFMA